MSDNQFGEIRFSALARAGEGLTQGRPLALGFLTLLLASAMVSLAIWLTTQFSTISSLMALLVYLLAVVVVLAGTSGVGAMLMDRAQNLPVRSFSDAAIFGLFCIPKFLGFALLMGLATLAFMLVAAVIYFVCRIPVLGGILAFIAHPVLIVVGAALLVAALFVVYPLFAPAVWSGLSMKAALASVIGIARKRLVPVVLLQLALYLVVWIISGLLMAGLLPVGLSLTGMAAGIIGANSDMISMMGSYGFGYGAMGMMSEMMRSSSMIGLGLGLGVLVAVVVALMGQVMILGLNLVYLQAQENVDTSDAEGALDGFLGDVRERAKQAAERAKEAAERAKQVAEKKAQDLAAANEARRVAAAEAKAVAAAQAAAAAQAEQQRLATLAETQATAQAQAEADRLAQAERDRAAAEAQRAADAQAQAQREAEAARLAAEQAAQQEQERLRAQAAQEAQAAEAAAEQAKAAASAAPVAPAAAPSCPSCHAAVSTSDAFCGECGHKLK